MPSRPSRPSPAIALVAVIVVTALLAGCSSSSGSGARPPGPKNVAGGTPAVGSTGASQGLLAGGAASDAASDAPSSPSATPTVTTSGDYTDVTYTVPDGYSKTIDGIYSPDIALEDDYKAYYFTPNSDPLGTTILSAFVYTLPDNRTVTDGTDLRARVRRYDSKLGATVKGSIRKTPVAGRTAIQESVTQPPNFKYLAWFVFGAQHFLEYTCQFTSSTDTKSFSTACASMLQSLQTTSSS